jgi:hypothetical protein
MPLGCDTDVLSVVYGLVLTPLCGRRCSLTLLCRTAMLEVSIHLVRVKSKWAYRMSHMKHRATDATSSHAFSQERFLTKGKNYRRGIVVSFNVGATFQ